ncbi:ferritin-like domain-containing protein [Sagittula salina]|uniref:Ferritin-like domain-containing protein n=1 Tax=Sagittula salina TaxID=2820268 RepID=A0A940RZH7_9RHOB|nr:ferritin-like domain-containing protein [Sagittula salina]MBP0481998.1 ferritin-like domain-containing protein [Sagittula salina]
MSLNSLKDVYVDQLQDLYSACAQSHAVMDDLAGAAENDDLRAALEAGKDGIADGMSKLEHLISGHGAEVGGEHCKGMEGLVAEARAHGLEEDFGDADARDAMIITQYQRMAHYAIAGYGCCAAFANRLDFMDEAETLSQMLEAAYSGDRHFSGIAQGQVNRAAAE